MNKNIIYIVSLLLIAGAFYGGMKYDASKSASARAGRVGQFTTNGNTRVGGGGFNRQSGDSFTIGQILSKNTNGFTIQLISTSTTSAGSAIVFLSSSTTIMKTTALSPTDLVVGQQVTVTGVKNPDGSINANSIQLRPKN